MKTDIIYLNNPSSKSIYNQTPTSPTPSQPTQPTKPDSLSLSSCQKKKDVAFGVSLWNRLMWGDYAKYIEDPQLHYREIKAGFDYILKQHGTTYTSGYIKEQFLASVGKVYQFYDRHSNPKVQDFVQEYRPKLPIRVYDTEIQAAMKKAEEEMQQFLRDEESRRADNAARHSGSHPW